MICLNNILNIIEAFIHFNISFIYQNVYIKFDLNIKKKYIFEKNKKSSLK